MHGQLEKAKLQMQIGCLLQAQGDREVSNVEELQRMEGFLDLQQILAPSAQSIYQV